VSLSLPANGIPRVLYYRRAIPESALYEEQQHQDDDDDIGEDNDDEKTGNRYNVRLYLAIIDSGSEPATVLMVPCHFCWRRHVCCYAPDRLVRVVAIALCRPSDFTLSPNLLGTSFPRIPSLGPRILIRMCT
jgi:hypothetical protein